MRAWDVRDDTLPNIRDSTMMDDTQVHALCRMISQELSIIQGPPGTGKTFTSVEALKVILANQGSGNSPVIVAAQTNHALDQLLTLCLDAGARIARVGGRTESERIEEHTMFNLRKKFLLPGVTLKGIDSRRRKACNSLEYLTRQSSVMDSSVPRISCTAESLFKSSTSLSSMTTWSKQRNI